MLPSRSTLEDTDDGVYALSGPEMREVAGVYADPAYAEASLFRLQDAAIALVETVVDAPLRGKLIVDFYRAPGTRLQLSARPIGDRPLRATQITGLEVVATVPGHEDIEVPAMLDASGALPAVVVDAPPLDPQVACPLRAAYRFEAAAPLPPVVVEAVSVAFRGIFDMRYRGGPPVTAALVETALGPAAALLGPYD